MAGWILQQGQNDLCIAAEAPGATLDRAGAPELETIGVGAGRTVR